MRPACGINSRKMEMTEEESVIKQLYLQKTLLLHEVLFILIT